MKYKFCIFCGILLMHSVSAQAMIEAGELQKKEKKEPQAQMYVTNNIAALGVDDENIGEVEEINFSADEMISDENSGLITASGDVEIEYNGMRLQTDKLIYDQNTDTITALNNVRLYTGDGSIIYGDKVSLADNMSMGEMHKIKAYLRDKSRVLADTFRKKDNQTKVLQNAAYTACDVCQGKNPLWEVTARKIQHNEKTKNVNYNDAVIKFKGVPLFYTPFLTHPDPTVKRRSGLLPPRMGSSNYLRGYFQPRYFWAVDDQTNVILSPIFSEEKNIVWDAAYKHYFYSGDTDLYGSYIKDGEDNRPKHRGHLFAKGRNDLTDNWRMTYDLKYASDYLYLKDLNLPYDDDAWLDSRLTFERFSGRDYVSVEAYYYKMLSYNLHRRNIGQYRMINDRKPVVAPLIEAELYSDPNANGSYFKNNFSTASIYHRNGSETQRLTAINAWEMPWTSQFGEKYRFVASVKSDGYYVRKYDNQIDTYTGTVGRIFPQAGVEWRLPFVRATSDSRQIVEPVVVAVAAPDGGNNADKIPNEDSQDVYFDDTNVLDLDRYAGYDRNDTGSRVSYGMRWNSYGDIMGRTSAFIAQSYERNDRSSFAKSLDSNDRTHVSDLVGRVNAEPNRYLTLNYRFRLDRKTFDAKYSELSSSFGPSFLRLNMSYIFLQGNTHYYERYSERKELSLGIKVALSQFWTVKMYNLRDLTQNSRGNLEHGGSVIYEDECFKWVTTVKKYNSSNPSLDNDYEYGMTFYLKTIGGFGS